MDSTIVLIEVSLQNMNLQFANIIFHTILLTDSKV